MSGPGGGGRYVALLRGINVGRAKRVAMADLRRLFEDLGCRDVSTLLNSGNVVFTAPAGGASGLAARAEGGIEKRLGVSCRVTLLTADEVREITATQPPGAGAEVDPSRLLVCVLADAADRAKLAPLAKADWGHEAVALGKRAAYVYCPEGLMDSAPMRAIAGALGDGVTSRNWATMLKLRAALGVTGPARLTRRPARRQS